MVSQYGPVICGCSSEECRLNGCRIVRENMKASNGFVPLPKQIEYKQEDVDHLQARAAAYDKMLPKYIAMQDELEELREEVQAGNLSLGYANEIIAKCEQEIKQYSELCGELVVIVDRATSKPVSLGELPEIYRTLAKAKERLGK